MKGGGNDNKWRGLVDTSFSQIGRRGGDDNKWKSLGKNQEFDTHLDENGKTIDGVKEIQNFRKAGQTLSEIWSKMTIDDYEVSAKWVDPSDDSKAYHNFRDSKIGKNWLETHVYKLVADFGMNGLSFY